jgi:hypothetical protein
MKKLEKINLLVYFENKSTFKMEEKPDFEKDLASIRDMMERSIKFISLSGLAGVMAGVYAIVAATYVYLNFYRAQLLDPNHFIDVRPDQLFHLSIVGIVTLAASLTTGIYFSYRKANRLKISWWSNVSKQLFINLAVPLVSGGLFILIMMHHNYYGLVAPGCLLFYGLALVNASRNLVEEFRYLGYCEIVLGIVSSFYVGYGLVFWAIGFGVLHIVYGLMMYRKYDA